MTVLAACDREYFFFEAKEISSSGWNADEPAVFEFDTQDTSSYLNFFLDLRNTDDYPYRNIYCFIEMEFPNGRSLTDTLHYPTLATPEGKWTGKGVGSTYDSNILYKQGKKLPLPGEYRIKVTHAMRDRTLVGIERVGIHIESGLVR